MGLGVWSDMIVVPYFAMACLLLVFFCWRELFSPALLFLLGGFCFGMMPLLIFNYESLNGTNSFFVLLGLFHGSGEQAVHTLSQILHNILSTIQVSVPMATGEPFCPVNEWPWIGDNSSRSTACARPVARVVLPRLPLLLRSEPNHPRPGPNVARYEVGQPSRSLSSWFVDQERANRV